MGDNVTCKKCKGSGKLSTQYGWEYCPKCKASGIHPADDQSASGFLTEAAATLAKRGDDYDQPGGERSMARITAAYNAVKGSSVMSETDGWLFMVLLKMVRGETAPGFHRDSYVDGSAYYGLMSESAAKEGASK